MREVISDSCFLCGHDSKYIETDFANRRHYKCEHEQCGEYEITYRAMRNIENNGFYKEHLISLAHEAKNNGEILELMVERDNSITPKFIAKS